MRLLLVRHGVTRYNLEGLFTGQADAPLTELGKSQAAAAGVYLQHEHLDIIAASDLQRARDTAHAIAIYHQLPVREEVELREIGMGSWEGYSSAQVQELYAQEWQQVRSDPINIAPTGGESWSQLAKRVEIILRRYRKNYAGQTVLWASHGAFIEAAICCALKLDLSYRHSLHQENTSINELLFLENRELPVIIRLNDTAHLRLPERLVTPATISEVTHS